MADPVVPPSENAEWPPGGDVGYYEAERVDDTTARVRCKTPYPCTDDEALVEGTAELFADGFVRATETSEQCRADGGEECVYEVTW